ncbi:family 78 glycoside hydrolase catalytic domain [Agromyces sp. NPDC055520]
MTSRIIRATTMFGIVFAIAVGTLAPAPGSTAIAATWDEPQAPTELTIGQLPAPRDVADLDAPLLGWQVRAARQSAYQVQVADDVDALDSASVWDSGRVESTASTNIPYAGPALEAAEGYVWRVRTWSGDSASEWSEPARFGTAAGTVWGDSTPIWLGSTGPTWADYTVEGNFRITAQNATIVLRARDASNYLMWQFRGNGVNTLAPHTRVGSTFTQLKSVPLGKTLANDTAYAFKIVASGTTITTYLDGVQVDVTTVGSTFSTGAIGFRTGGSERNTWDDLLATAANGTVLYQSTFNAPSTDFTCGTVVDGRLAIGTSQNCVYGVLPTDWALLRGEVDLEAKDIAWATVYATAASTAPARQFVYKLWINGSFVGLGPTLPIASETRYDGFDVTSLVRSGEANTLGAIAYTTSDKRFQAYLVVEYADGSKQTFGTGPAWTAYSGANIYPAVGSIGTSYFVAPKENIQAAGFPTGFDQPGFDDSAWTPATVKDAFSDLQATPTAKVEHQLKYPESVVEKSPGNYFIDYGRTWIGGLSLDVEGAAGQVLDVRFGEALSAPQTVRFAMNTGNTYQDKWTLKAGPQHLETWGMRVFRYAEVLGAPSGLTADDFPALAQVYPYDPDGAHFSSSDSSLNQVWELSRHTVDATNHNLYVDSWTRERDAYEADSYLQMMANFFVSDDPTLGNYSLEYLLTGRTWPTEWPMYTILAFHDSYLQTGDTAALARNYDALKQKLPDEWLEASTGLIRKNTGSNGSSSCTDCDIVDWPASERDGYVFRPYNTVINAIGHQSYRDMADIARALGKDADAEAFTATADRLRQVSNERLFDQATGAYRDGLNADGTAVNHYAIQASVFATAFGLADANQASQTAEYIRTRGMACSVYCAAFVIESLYNGDRADVAHALLTSTGLRSWMNMIAKGAGATMEAWDPTLKSNLTYSHPWAASPAYNVPQGMFGIQPTTPGYATFDIRPQPASVEWAGVRLPTLKGSIGAAHHTVGDRTDVGVNVPGNTVARVFVPGAAEESVPIVYVDGIETPATYERGYLRVDDVPAGCHVLSLAPGDGPGQDEHLTNICPDGYIAPDLTAPVVSLATDPAAPSGDNGWYTGAVNVAATAADEASGVASLEYGVEEGSWTSYSEPLAAPEGETTFLFRATDRAGNVSVTEAVTIRRDVTAPGLAWVGDLADESSHVFGSVPDAPTCEATDALSGEAGCDVAGFSAEVGTHTLTATARDLAGNQTAETRTYTVTPWTLTGFTSPVDMDGVLNVVKAGSTVPLRFEVFAGDRESTSTDAIDGLRTVQTPCRSGASTDEIESTVAGGTDVVYDSDAGRFQYNWKSPKGATGCVKLILSTVDGSELTALFQFK